MRILMLGWEFPPFIAGGLGTACYGLTKALDRLGHEVVFVLPKPVDRSHSSHIRLLSPEAIRSLALPLGATAGSFGAPARLGGVPDGGVTGATGSGGRPTDASYTMPGFDRAVFHGVPAAFSSPYPAFDASGRALDPSNAPSAASIDSIEAWVNGVGGIAEGEIITDTGEVLPGISGGSGGAAALSAHSASAAKGGPGAGYEGDMFEAAGRYARLVVALSRRERFDVIHAHDWMTFPAGLALATVTGKPLVIHVHSTEFDRAGDNVNQRVYDVERRGMHSALRVVAVSELTKGMCVRRYGLDPAKVDVVYNGIDSDAAQPHEGDRIESRDKIVLFLGRITMQKGPEYFIRAAKRVLEKEPHAKFVVAGSGDMAVRMIEEAAQLGIGHKVLFTGFLRGPQVDRIFRMAHCYVMPSVSEPFGIAPLEAMRNDVPVIISKQSGVSEVLTHALKVDFWDIDEMANKIVAVLRHPPLGQTLREHGAFELRKLTWDGAAVKCVQSYAKAISAQSK